MAWVAVAIGGSAIVSSYSSNRAASKASKAASKSAKSELDFAKAQYQDWLDAFGDIQNNLADYYEKLTPDFMEAQSLQAFEQEKSLALQQLEADLEQRGISTSGLAKETYEDLTFASAAERARIRAEAPLRSAQAQQEFLQIGLGQNPASNVQGALADRTAQLSSDARLAGQAAARSTAAAVDTTFDALTKILNSNSTTAGDVGAPVGDPNATEAARTV